VEPHGVLRGDEVEPPLRLALQREHRRELLLGCATRPRRLRRVEQVGQRRGRSLEQRVRPALNRVNARLDL
jgi:hypothetical protein